MKKFGQLVFLARKLVPAMLCGGQRFDEIGRAHFCPFGLAGFFRLTSRTDIFGVNT
jgi:hypothetical protein